MKIIPSAEIRNNYRKVADECLMTGEPIFLTNNGVGELVVMSIDSYNEERTRQKIERELRRIEAKEAAGKAEYITIEELTQSLDEAIESAIAETSVAAA